MNTIIFIGGVPGVGKTTLAYKLATKYKIDKVISLDVIKNTLKCLVDANDKYLFTTTHQAYEIDNLSVVDGYLNHTKSINEYYYQIIEKFKDEKVIIVEGATITSEFVKKFKNYNVIYINLYIKSNKALIKRYENKNKMREGKWINNLKQIKKINNYLIEQSTLNINADNENVLESVGNLLNESIFL